MAELLATIEVWRDSSGDWRWRVGSVFGCADSQAEARAAAERFAAGRSAGPGTLCEVVDRIMQEPRPAPPRN